MARARSAWGWTLALVACGPLAAPAEEGDASTGAGSDTNATSFGTTSTPTPTAGEGADTTAGAGADTGPGTEGTSEDTGPVCANLPLGSPCSDPACDCESDQCFVLEPLPGVCSECDEDADCEPGFCDFGNPLTMTPAVCTTGAPPCKTDDCPCETADDCPMGEYCPGIIEVPGILSTSFCSECDGDLGCVGDELCVPTYDIANISGYYYCTVPGSVPDEQGCNVDGDGTECASGQCAPAALMGIPVMGLCSPCNDDADCGGGMTCQLPELQLVGDGLALAPGMCV